MEKFGINILSVGAIGFMVYVEPWYVSLPIIASSVLIGISIIYVAVRNDH